MLIGISKSDKTIVIVKTRFMSTPHCPLSRSLETAADTAAAGDFNRTVDKAFLRVEDDGATSRFADEPGTPPLARMITGHSGGLKPDTAPHGSR